MEAIDLTGYQGTDITFNIPLKYNDTGLPVDITGYTFYFTLKNSLDDSDADALIAKTITEFDHPELGIAFVTLDYADTEPLSGNFFYDFKYKDVDGKVRKIAFGKFKFIRTRTEREGD